MTVWLLALALQAHAHQAPSPSAALEIATRPVPLRTGIGTAHDPVGTASKQAQAFYDQGLAYLHSYVWIEAARSFRQALRSDPHLGMADVGLADAYIGLQDADGRSLGIDSELLGRSEIGAHADHDP